MSSFCCCFKRRKTSVADAPVDTQRNTATIETGTTSNSNNAQNNSIKTSLLSENTKCKACSEKRASMHLKMCECCNEPHCIQCLHVPPSPLTLPPPSSSLSTSLHLCVKCTKLSSGVCTRLELSDGFSVRELRKFLLVHNVSMEGCTEKSDLVVLILRLVNQTGHGNEALQHDDVDENTQPVTEAERLEKTVEDHLTATLHKFVLQHAQLSLIETDASACENKNVATPSAENLPPCSTERHNGSADACVEPDSNTIECEISRDVATPGDVILTSAAENLGVTDTQQVGGDRVDDSADNMTVEQLRDCVLRHNETLSGDETRDELIARVKQIQSDHQSQEPSEGSTAVPTINNPAQVDGNRRTLPNCKICNAVPMDCVLLDCGHMTTCTGCAKGLTDCPICHQYIKRVVHAYRV